MKNKNLNPLALSLSIVAVGLSIYALFVAGGLDFINPKKDAIADKDKPVVSKEFTQDVYAVIDKYIAEKQAEQQGPPAPTGPVDVSLDDDAVKGDKDAPVTIVEFTDYECPYCESFFTNAYAEIMKNYVDTGKVKYVLRDFPLPFHAKAIGAANAAECAKDQGKDEMYFKFHDLLFQNQASLSPENYKKWAAELNLDQEEFNSCVDEEKFADEVAADLTEGQSYGVQGTPAFFINGMPLSGAQPYAAFEAAIETALVDAEKK